MAEAALRGRGPDRPRRGPDRRHGGDADHDLPGPAIHRVPAGQGVRAAHPRGGAAGAPREGRHAHDGRPHHLRRHLGAVPGALRARYGEPGGLRGRPWLRRHRPGGRLDQDLEAPLARAFGPLQAPRPDPAGGGALLRRDRGDRPRDDDSVARLRRRDRDPRRALRRLHLPRDRGRVERRQSDRRPRRPGRGIVRDRLLGLHRDHRSPRVRRASRSSRPASSEPPSAFCGSTRSPRRSSWATPARWGSAARSARLPS